jgi:hypothetical protein
MAGMARGVRALVVTAALLAASCSRTDRQLAQHHEAFASLSATTQAIGDAWLSGDVSGTYTLTALDRTYLLVEQQRSSLAGSASMLNDRRGAVMSDAAEQLSRHIAAMIANVDSGDAGAARAHLSALPFKSS